MVDKNRQVMGSDIRNWKMAAAFSLLILVLSVSAAFFIGSTDGELKDSVHALESALQSLSQEQHIWPGLSSQARNSRLTDLHQALKTLKNQGSKNQGFISDETLHKLELALTSLARQLANSESQRESRHAVDQVANKLEILGLKIGSLLFIAKNDVKAQMHTEITKALHLMLKVSTSSSLPHLTATIEVHLRRPVNFLQLLLDLIAAVSFSSIIFKLSSERHWRRIMFLCVMPLAAFGAVQLLQWRTLRVSAFESVNPTTTVAVIAITGCFSVAMATTNDASKLIMSVAVALAAAGTQIFLCSHVSSSRSVLGLFSAPEMPCPMPAVPLATYDSSSQRLFLTQEASYRLPKLTGPLYVLSEIGGFNTGKSVRLTVSYRLLLPRRLRDRCKCGFVVRNADADPTLVHSGMTRGLWMMALPVSQIDVSDTGSSSLISAVKKLDPAGTIIFLDSEGGDEAGKDSATINLMQLLVVQLSSHMNFAVEEKLTQRKVSDLAMLAHFFKLFTAFERGRQSCHQVKTASDPTASLSQCAVISMKGSNLLPLFPDVKSSGGRVISVPTQFSLDATQILLGELEKSQGQSHTKSAADLVKKFMPHLAYWGTLPATPDEVEFFASMDAMPGLPQEKQPGFVLGWSVFNLPAILNRLHPKTMQKEIMNGSSMLKFMQQFIHITNEIDSDWLRSESSKDLSAAICKFVTDRVKIMLKEAEHEIDNQLPVESNPVCSNPENKCPDADFDNVWSSVTDNITDTTCLVKTWMTDEAWKTCWNEEVEPEVSQVRDRLRDRNRKLCQYNWVTEDWSSCQGDCQKYQMRSSSCLVNKMRSDQPAHSRHRPTRCCLQPEPETYRSCDIWSHRWRPGPWSQCNGIIWGTQHRNLRCLRCDGEPADEKVCLANEERPQTEQSCNIFT